MNIPVARNGTGRDAEREDKYGANLGHGYLVTIRRAVKAVDGAAAASATTAKVAVGAQRRAGKVI